MNKIFRGLYSFVFNTSYFQLLACDEHKVIRFKIIGEDKYRESVIYWFSYDDILRDYGIFK